jgi:hypothetical protein
MWGTESAIQALEYQQRQHLAQGSEMLYLHPQSRDVRVGCRPELGPKYPSAHPWLGAWQALGRPTLLAVYCMGNVRQKIGCEGIYLIEPLTMLIRLDFKHVYNASVVS